MQQEHRRPREVRAFAVHELHRPPQVVGEVHVVLIEKENVAPARKRETGIVRRGLPA